MLRRLRSVSIAPGQPSQYRIYGRLCLPSGATPTTLELLVPGITYTHLYWAFPDPTGHTNRYDYTDAAISAGYATLAIDRIGTGLSSRPLGALVTIQSNAYTVHQVVQAIRNGAITSTAGHRFQKIIYVGHSYGSWTGWYEVNDYHDVDAFVVTGATHHVNGLAPVEDIPRFYPADLDSQLSALQEDPTYLTTQPGARYQLFYRPAPVDPAVLAYDESHKSTVTATEIALYPLIVARRLDIRVPTLIVQGEMDSLFCGPTYGGANCSSANGLLADERGYYGPEVPSLSAYVLPDAGHDLNMALDASSYFTVVQHWIDQNVGGAG